MVFFIDIFLKVKRVIDSKDMIYQILMSKFIHTKFPI